MLSKFSVIQACATATSCLAFISCTTYEVQPAAQPVEQRLVNPHDAAAAVVAKCDTLGFTSKEAHRLCVMRGIDRLEVVPIYRSPCGYESTGKPGCTSIPLGANATVIPPGASHHFVYPR